MFKNQPQVNNNFKEFRKGRTSSVMAENSAGKVDKSIVIKSSNASENMALSES